jgi:hypothetical protein
MALSAMRGKKRKPSMKRIAGRLNDDSKHFGGLPLFADNMTPEMFEAEFNRAVNMFACTGTKQEKAKAAINYIKAKRKKDLKHIQNLPDSFLSLGVGTYCRVWEFAGKFTDDGQKYVDKKLNELVEHSKSITKFKKDEPAKTVITPQQRLKQKVYSTVIAELDEMEDAWINGEKAEIKLFERCKAHDIKGAAVSYIEEWLNGRLTDLEGAYNKDDKDLVEAYAHIKKAELKRQVKVLKDALKDCESLKTSVKAERKTRVKKPQAADKQVSKLNFLKSSNDFKVSSINPLLIVGAKRLLVFNTKNRKLEEYITDRPDGFEVKGQSILHVNKSRGKSLRKPEEFLPIALKKTAKQFEKEFDKLTTKEYKPNGRFNKSLIILSAK